MTLPNVNGSTSVTNARGSTNDRCAPTPPKEGRVTPNLPGTPGVVTPVDPDKLHEMLEGYPAQDRAFLVDGFTHGFHIPFQGTLPPPCHKNLPSALQYPEVINAKLEKEISKGRIAGPFNLPPFEQFAVSPLGVVPKKNPGEFRMIHHESYPLGLSINDGIPSDLTSVHYSTLQSAIAHIKSFGNSCFLSKTDIKDAFWIIPLHPDSYHLTGIYWGAKYYYFKSLPMGSSISCSLFERFSTALEWIAQNKLAIPASIHILDDFLFINKSFHLCQGDLRRFQQMCAAIGVPLAPEKTVGPSTCLPFVGIELDTIRAEARLPPDKLAKCQRIIQELLQQQKATLKSVQSLVGLLNFTCQVVLPGRPFLRRLIDLTMGVQKPYHFVRLTRQVKMDLRTWLRFFQGFNGKAFFLQEKILWSPHINLFTDASGSLGFAGIYGSRWFYGPWDTPQKDTNITVLELYPITVAVHLYGLLMSNHCVTFVSDNEAVVAVINSMTCKHKQVMALVRPLVLACLKYNIFFKARHIPGVENTLADALSRLQVQKFRHLAPSARQEPDLIPPHLKLGALLSETEWANM